MLVKYCKLNHSSYYLTKMMISLPHPKTLLIGFSINTALISIKSEKYLYRCKSAAVVETVQHLYAPPPGR